MSGRPNVRSNRLSRLGEPGRQHRHRHGDATADLTIDRNRASARASGFDLVGEGENDCCAIDHVPVDRVAAAWEPQHLRMPVARASNDRRDERDLVVREAGELGAQENVGNVLVARNDVETPADVEHAGRVIDGLERGSPERAAPTRGRALKQRARRRDAATFRQPSKRETSEDKEASFTACGGPSAIFKSLRAIPRGRPAPKPGCPWRVRIPPA